MTHLIFVCKYRKKLLVKFGNVSKETIQKYIENKYK